MTSPSHVPVLLDRVVALVAPPLQQPGSVMVDATLGLGGHTEAVLTRCPEARVIGVDRDVHALERSRERLAPFGDRVTFVHAVYDEIPDVLADLGLDHVDGVLFDLGVSSHAARRPGARLRLRRGRPARHADGRHDGAHRRRRPQHLPGRGAGPDPQAVRRGAVRPADRGVGRPGARARAVHPVRAARRPDPGRHPRSRPSYRRPPRQAHLPGAAHRGQRRAVGAAPGDPRGDGVDRRRRPRGRHVLPLARGPARQAGLHREDPQRPAARPPVRPRGPRAALRLVTRGAEKASAEEIAENPRAASVRLRAVERVRTSTGATA